MTSPNRRLNFLVMCLVFGGLVGCQTTQQQLLDSDQSQVQLRSIQTRAFDTTDKEKILRTVISTLQDLGFVIDKADLTLGTVTGTKLDQYRLRMTVTARPRGETQMLIRASAQYGAPYGQKMQPVNDPLPYQRFFTSFEKAVFLTAQKVD